MSADEDTELRDLVAQTLENNGVLGKIRAQLRASVFLALEEQDTKQNKPPFLNKEVQDFLSTTDGRLVACLVREFLDYFNLEFTQAVYDSETNLNTQYTCPERRELCRELRIEGEKSEVGPLLSEVLRRSRVGTLNARNDPQGLPQELTPQQIATARKKYQSFDKDHKGKIDRDDTCELLMEIFPHFRRNMVNQFVGEELRKMNKTFGSAFSEIDEQEFIDLYQSLFYVCRSVVLHETSIFFPSSKVPRSSSKPEEDGFLSLLKPSEEKAGSDRSRSEKSSRTEVKPSAASEVNAGAQNNNDDDSSGPEDSFFDDPPPPVEANGKQTIRQENKEEPTSQGIREGLDDGLKAPLSNKLFSSALDSVPPLVTTSRGGGLGSLRDAPSLINSRALSDVHKSANWKDLEAIDKRIADLGFDLPQDEDYEEDFQSSMSGRSDRKSGTEQSMEEEIEEDISGLADDLLNSTASAVEDMTTDKTVSQISGIGVDYLESCG